MMAPDDQPGRPPRGNRSTAGATASDREAASFAVTGAHATAEASGLYRLLVETVRDYAIFALDPTGHVLSWNAGAERLKGYKPEEIIGRHFSIFYPPDDIVAAKPERELEDAIRDGRVEDEGWRIRKDGSRFWANVVITALWDEDRKLVGFAKVTRDLTERRRAEEEVRQSEERFRLLVQGVKDYAIFMLDPQGCIESWNEGAQRIKGYTADEIIGRHFSEFYPVEDVAAGKPPWELEVAIREGKYEEEGWRVRKDGSFFWANVLITPMRDATGQLVGFTKVTRDLTERRAAQERAIADARRLAAVEAANRTKSEFLAAMSHELRTPINATMGYADLIKLGIGGEISEQHRDYLARIRSSQEHLLRIISDLLNYSRIEAGQVQYDITAIPVHEVAAAVVPMIQPQAVAKEIALTAACPEDVIARADRARTEQVVLNLLSNAVKFTPTGGRVEVGCVTKRSQALITIRDNGPGIPFDKQTAIFEPFVQLGRSLTSGHEGTGLGLAISRDLARAMGGDLTVESSPGKGATFIIALPAA
jgi:PAS domain S-box-containing protein